MIAPLSFCWKPIMMPPFQIELTSKKESGFRYQRISPFVSVIQFTGSEDHCSAPPSGLFQTAFRVPPETPAMLFT